MQAITKRKFLYAFPFHSLLIFGQIMVDSQATSALHQAAYLSLRLPNYAGASRHRHSFISLRQAGSRMMRKVGNNYYACAGRDKT